MTQLEQPEATNDPLFAALASTPTSEMGDATRRAGHFSPEDDDSDNRLSRAAQRRTMRKIRVAWFWILLVLLSLFVAFLFLGFALVLIHWVSGFWNDPTKVESFVYGVGWTIVVALATLFVEQAISAKD